MYLETIDAILVFLKRFLSFSGALIIFTGAIFSIFQFIRKIFYSRRQQHDVISYDHIRLDLGRSIILGLEFIIAADVIETTTTPDYYELGILGLLVLIRTFLNYFLNQDLIELSRREKRHLD